MNKKLYVGNLPFSTAEPALEGLFSQAGPVESVRVMRDQATGRARGFAFVEMQTDEGAKVAIEKFNQAEFEGRRLTVNEARPQTFGGSGGGGGNRPRGNGGGYGGGRGGDGGGRRREPRW